MGSPRRTQPPLKRQLPSSAGKLLALAAARLAAAGSTSARLEAELLLGRVTGWPRTSLMAHPEWAVTEPLESAFHQLVERRERHEPMAYLLGEREFHGHVFKVDRRALIPRPETELLVEVGCEAVRGWRGRGVEPVVVDVGTGSGAIAISVALACAIRVFATDSSTEALALAMENAYRLSPGQVAFVRGDLLGGLRAPLHVILANLPYVPSSRILPPDVGAFEPPLALYGGHRGTELIKRLLREAQPLLAPGGTLAVELDEEEQAIPVAALARNLYPSGEVSVLRDAGGYDRVVRIVR